MNSPLRGSLRLSATGSLSIDDLWRRYTRPEHWTQWAPHLRKVDYPEQTVRPGTAGRVTGTGGVVAHFRIDAVDEVARTWAWSVRFGPLRIRFEHGVQAAPSSTGEGATAWIITHGLWPVVLGYAPIARHSLGRLVSSR